MNKRILKRVMRFLVKYWALILFYLIVIIGVLVLNARFEYLNNL